MKDPQRRAEDMAQAVADVLGKALAPLRERLTLAEERLTALEAAPKSLDFRGIWQRAQEYRRNQGATHKGSLWVAINDSRAVEPGTSPVWQLAAKEDAR